MKVIHTKDFERSFLELPSDIQRQFNIQQQRFETSRRDPRLHIKKVRQLDHAFSLRITRRYRALFYFRDEEAAVFFDVDHRKDIYRS